MPRFFSSRFLGDGTFAPNLSAESFSPNSLSGLALWLDASQINGALENDPINVWEDVSGNGLDATANSAMERPLYKSASLGGKPCLSFNSTSRMSNSVANIPTTAGARTVFVVANGGTGQVGGGLLSYRLTDKTWSALAWNRTMTSTFLAYSDEVDVNNTAKYRYSSVPVVEAPFINTYYTVGNNQPVKARTNGTNRLVTSTSGIGVAEDGDTGFAVGYAPISDVPWTGDIAEIICYSRTLSDTEIGQIETYLSAKYSISITWVPTDLGTTKLRAWYRGSSITGVLNNDPVSTWPDSSGNSRDLTAAGAARPLYSASSGPNSLPSTKWDGTTMRMQTADFAMPLAQPSTILTLVNVDPTMVDQRAIFDGKSAGSRQFISYKGGTNQAEIYAGAMAGLQTFTPLDVHNVSSLFTSIFDGASSLTRISSNTGSTETSGDAGAHSADGYTVGSRYTDDSFCWIGYISDIVAMGSVSSQERERAEAFLFDKYGMY